MADRADLIARLRTHKAAAEKAAGAGNDLLDGLIADLGKAADALAAPAVTEEMVERGERALVDFCREVLYVAAGTALARASVRAILTAALGADARATTDPVRRSGALGMKYGDRVEMDGRLGTAGEFFHDGEVEVHFDDGKTEVVKWRRIRPDSMFSRPTGPETYPGHDPAAGLPQPDTAGGAVSLAECPVGLFVPVARPEALCLKTEYRSNGGRIDAYIVSTGEFFWGSAPQTIANQRKQMVIPFDIATREAAIRAEATAKERERCADRVMDAHNEWWRLSNEHGERFAAWKRGGEEGPMPDSRLGSLPYYIAAAIRGGGE